jgi:type III secretion system FlhB-like substrate exporter
MAIKLANEIIDTANDIGNTIKKKKKLIKWLKQIKLLHILDINLFPIILAKSLK